MMSGLDELKDFIFTGSVWDKLLYAAIVIPLFLLIAMLCIYYISS
jgi:hypothetical protein